MISLIRKLTKVTFYYGITTLWAQRRAFDNSLIKHSWDYSMLTHTTDFPKVLLLQLVLGAYKLLISFLCSIVIFFFMYLMMKKWVQIITKSNLQLMINYDCYKDIKNNLKRRKKKGKWMQQLLKRFKIVKKKVRFRFANWHFS